MVIECCQCNGDIPGVQSLPWHVHTSRMELVEGGRPNEWAMVSDIEFNVDWKQIARDLMTEKSAA